MPSWGFKGGEGIFEYWCSSTPVLSGSGLPSALEVEARGAGTWRLRRQSQITKAIPMRATTPTPPAMPPIRAPFEEPELELPEVDAPDVDLEPGVVGVDEGFAPAPVPV